MVKQRIRRIEPFNGEDSTLWPTNMLAEEDRFDRKAWWRLASWGIGAVAAVTVAILANQRATGLRGEQLAAADMLRQSRQLQGATKEAQGETRRLVSEVDTLNGDRDRMYARLTALEQNLESVTGSLSRQNAASPPPRIKPVPAPPAIAAPDSRDPPPGAEVAPLVKGPAEAAQAQVKADRSNMPENAAHDPKVVATTAGNERSKVVAGVSSSPSTDDRAAQAAAMTPPGDADSVKTATLVPTDTPDPAPAPAVHRTEFGVDLGGATTIEGLRSLWFRAVATSSLLAPLRPIIVVKELTTRPATELRLVAGPLVDAAAAAQICAVLAEHRHSCAPSEFDGQRLPISLRAAQAPHAHRRRMPIRLKPDTAAPSKPPQALSSTVGSR